MWIKNTQLHNAVLKQRHLLIRDIEEHLGEYLNDTVLIYPRKYLHWVINDSIEIASQFMIDDVFSMRLFVRLRFEIGPGFYKQPQIAQVLSQTELKAQMRFNTLAKDDYADAWEDAGNNYDDIREWRLELWSREK